MSIMEQVKQNLREWYSLAADRTSEMTKISVRMYDKYGISREIERQLSELGCHVYHAVEAGRVDFLDDEIFHAVVMRIKELERDLSAKVAEIEAIRQQRQQKAAMRQETTPKRDGPIGDTLAGSSEVSVLSMTEPTPGSMPSGDMGSAASQTFNQEAASKASPAVKRDVRPGSSESS